ncbi:bifunctional nicotinamidase/pyrazinamidase [Elizabethkingia meningoseptica]|uniref:nicotinamidase n=1 Tax=Elizabethkingia meningoseptica TaxID=238 RepID=A0A1V3U0X4_ELIME|nr:MULTISPECIES: bifunctional nicotinamidase/pyrazinamidase [Elizabethkingia]AQX06046.1 nicotinamidase [Elizabethkingia meningoseptica]AQX13588.1 nicotinamidase [Elizabethkingia meningoseptica]AQX48092.1 nicotinamidase [Elizabethkingia meningoseptica]EJK5327520.1 bifunctional nicotinamidase/pyrazinamidase [Elizabethkingia meningoseptica]EOR31019.1 Nicotinamidase [Elizabethkingia meningoseptica ATCC 13253 = NBRC 12535]
MKKALIIVDVQNDFCEGGSLAVPGASEIIPYINSLMESDGYDQIVLTQDYHPANHKSFASNNDRNVGETIILNGIPQFMWPVHCVQGTPGADFHPALNKDKATHIIQKGKNSEIDSYSAFQDNNHFMKTGLADFLKYHDIQLVEVAGLALDYCVRATCLDSVKEGFVTCLHFNGTRAVNVKPDSGKNTIYELIENKVSILA